MASANSNDLGWLAHASFDIIIEKGFIIWRRMKDLCQTFRALPILLL
jgi:hypothetical protein